jgi:thymidylate synthase (FAD)
MTPARFCTLMDEIKLLDHGLVRFVESWGSDERIIEAARMSTGKGFLGWEPGQCPVCGGDGKFFSQTECPNLGSVVTCYGCEGKGEIKGDAKLLAYLWNNRHATPFEMAGMTIVVQAPIFVFREWHRHRTQSYNEMSARYVPLPDLNYVPTVERLMLNSKTNKQAGTVAGAGELTTELAEAERQDLREDYRRAEESYQRALQRGVPKELARVRLPVGRYSRMMASTDLRNWLSFLTLRMAPGAQYEIRVYAEAVGRLIAETFPRTWGLFVAPK